MCTTSKCAPMPNLIEDRNSGVEVGIQGSSRYDRSGCRELRASKFGSMLVDRMLLVWMIKIKRLTGVVATNFLRSNRQG